MVFDGPGAQLPMATLRPSALRGRRHALAADLDRWLATRWHWVRPRAVPLLAALLGLLVTLGAVKYVAVYALADNLALEMRARMTDGDPTAVLPPPCHRCRAARAVVDATQIVIKPLRSGDQYIVLTLAPSAPR